MKRLVLFMYLLLCVLLFCSCASDGAEKDTPGETGEFRSVTQEVFPDAPPTMTVVCGEEQITAWRGTYSWETVNALGIGQAVCADSMHPLDAAKDFPEEFPVLTVSDGAAVTLRLDAVPDGVTVQYYPDGSDSYDPSKIHIMDCSALTLDVQTGIYEIIATWDKQTEHYSGEVHYAFRVYDSYRVVGISYENDPDGRLPLSFEMIYEDALENGSITISDLDRFGI